MVLGASLQFCLILFFSLHFLYRASINKTELPTTLTFRFSFVFLFLSFLKFVPYTALGFFDRQSILADVLLAPVALAGVWAGVFLHKKVPERAFFTLTYALLLITGTKLIWDVVF